MIINDIDDIVDVYDDYLLKFENYYFAISNYYYHDFPYIAVSTDIIMCQQPFSIISALLLSCV